MKASLLLSLVILLAGGLFTWKQGERLERIREVRREVVAEAEALGISAAAGDEGAGKGPRIAERERGEREAKAKALTAEVIAFAKEMQEIQKSGKQPDAEMQKRIMEVMSRFTELDPAQLKIVIAELRANPEIDDEMRRGIIGMSVMMMASEHPQAALALFTESSDLMGRDGMGSHVVSSALGKWAEQDPLGALDWIRENSEKHSALVTDQTKAAVVAGAAKQDPKLALSLIAELKLDNGHQIGSALARVASTDAERTALLEALRSFEGDKDGEVKKTTLGSLGGLLADGGFDKAVEWISTAELSGEEKESMVLGLSHWQTKDDTGKWIEWMGEETSGSGTERIGHLMSSWTREDYKAAGTWLSEAEEGPAKSAAVRSYAESVAPYEPDAAAQWARTLPQGDERTELMKSIHQQWKGKDEEAAAAFAAEEGIGD